MKDSDPSVEDLEAHWALLNGPLRPVYEQAGHIIARKLRERGASLNDLSDLEMGAVLFTSLIEAASDLYPGIDVASLGEVMELTLADAAMALAANAEGSDGLN